MKKTMKYIIAILIAAIGVYNLINWFGQGSAMPLYFAIEAFCLCGTLTGAYVKADSTRLTVSGDYNGDGSKIVFRINGVRLPYVKLQTHPKAKNNEHYKERIRATIYEHKDQYVSCGNGCYRLSYQVA